MKNDVEEHGSQDGPPTSDLLEEVDALYACEQTIIDNPFPLYGRLRNEAPVLVHQGVAAVSRYADAEAFLLNATDYSNARGSGTSVEALAATMSASEAEVLRECVRFHDRWLVRLDPPDHTRIRGLAHRVFTPRRIVEMQEKVQLYTDQLLDAVSDKEQVDVVSEIATRLPLLVVGDMLGVPTEDQEQIHLWSQTIASFIGNHFLNSREMFGVIRDFRAYLQDMIAERRQTRHTDLLAALLAPDESGDRLTAEELQGMFMLLLFAGHDTTSNLIASELLMLLQEPDQLNLLRRDLSLLTTATEESLRYQSPNQTVHRYARRTTVVRGTPIPAGTSILVMVGAANRDPNQFADPERFDVTREAGRHLAFGLGSHFCLGQALARLEAPIAIGSILQRFPRLELVGDVHWKPNLMFRGPAELRVELHS
jgi:cytochrome P450